MRSRILGPTLQSYKIEKPTILSYEIIKALNIHTDNPIKREMPLRVHIVLGIEMRLEWSGIGWEKIWKCFSRNLGNLVECLLLLI